MFKKLIVCGALLLCTILINADQSISSALVDKIAQGDLSDLKLPPIKAEFGLSPDFPDQFRQAFKGSGEQINENTISWFQAVGQGLPLMGTGVEKLGRSVGAAAEPVRNVFVTGVLATVGISALIIATAIIVKQLCVKYINKYVYEPSLIEKRSTSLRRNSSWFRKKTSIDDIRKHMVIGDQLHQQLNYVMKTTANIKKHGGMYENVLLYGAPGTGKTLFAELLSIHCGMEYAFIPGANVSQFLAKGTAVQELNELFAWAQKSKRGTILFFDEAETFLADRSLLSIEAQNALNAFLAKTGTASNRVMIICATNRPEMLDKAVLSRLSMHVHFPLPNEQERQDQLKMHIQRTFGKQEGTTVAYECLQDPTYITTLAERLVGYSGRMIQQFVNRVRQYALAQDCLTIDPMMVDQVLAYNAAHIQA